VAMTREDLRKHINDNCIVRVPEGSQELPNMEGSGFYSWQFYLRPVTMNGDWLRFISRDFWYRFYELFHKNKFQIVGIESASLPIIGAILSGGPSGVNSFAVRKERKKYGLGNIIEGRPNGLPVLFVDDLTSPQHYAFWKTVRALSEAKLRLYPHSFVVVRKQYRQVDPIIATSIGTTRVESLFTLDDFDLERDDPELRAEFDRCWPWIESVLDYFAFSMPDGTFWRQQEKHHIWEEIAGGRRFFWPGKNCAITTKFVEHPSGLKTQFISSCGGKLEEILEMMPAIEDFGRRNGCHRQISEGRDGWLRVVEGYRKVGMRKEKSLISDPLPSADS
jgi:orotate phosphoribosyltransferase